MIKHGVKGELDSAGLPLGMFAEAEYMVSRVQLEASDSLLLFTDGVTETANAGGKEFGTAGLSAALDGRAFDAPSRLIAHCVDSVAAFRGRAESRDDLSMLALTFA